MQEFLDILKDEYKKKLREYDKEFSSNEDYVKKENEIYGEVFLSRYTFQK